MTTLLLGNCLEKLADMPDCSIDAIVTDPPYGLSFMGKKWDYDVPSVEVWAECLRVLKPGGHLLAFAGTRTQHRMAVRIEDAGFEIRDLVMWHYGSGFPKSLDVSKAIDKAAGAEREVVGSRRLTGTARIKGQAAYGATSGRSEDAYQDGSEINDTLSITAPTTPEAQQWQGWGTALKPATEIVTVARKPLQGTVAGNVLQWGTGGINVDGCRIPATDKATFPAGVVSDTETILGGGQGLYANRARTADSCPNGRWPANLIHDGSDEVVKLFPESKGQQGAIFGEEPSNKTNAIYGEYQQRNESKPRSDTGSAARFFYCAKTSRRERGEGNNHPTVKPIALMRYLCRLVTPPSGVVLDPFMGSGSTGIAASQEGLDFIGIELDPDYFAIAEKRIQGQSSSDGGAD